MLNLILLFVFGILLSFVVDKEPEDVLPAFIATMLVMLYGLGIIGYAHHSYEFMLIIFAVIYLGYALRYRRLVPSISQLQNKLFNRSHVGLLLYVCTVAVMMYCYSNHIVNVWDDFHYNATFPRNMYYYGTMPYGFQSTTMYKDYFPTQQLFFYWGFQGIRAFSEPMMFQYKLFLVYTFMLPVFRHVNEGTVIKRVMAGVAAVVMPFMCLFEILESLSMDTVLALLFANAVVAIVERRDIIPEASDDTHNDAGNMKKCNDVSAWVKYEWFSYYRIMIFMTALVLYKSYALIFACICMGVLVLDEIVKICKFSAINRSCENNIDVLNVKTRFTGLITSVCICLITFSAFLSWRIFCRRHGNTTYLSNILADNVAGSGGFALPDYGLDTIKNILDALVSMRLNFGDLSVTVLSGVLIYAITAALMVLYKRYRACDLVTDIMMVAGLAGFIMFLMYTYVFVFEQWEAESLSSLDRYLGTYVLVLMFISACRIFRLGYTENAYMPMMAFTAVCVISLNYSLLRNALIPDNYMAVRQEVFDVRAYVHDEIDGTAARDLWNSRIMLMYDDTDTLYMRSLQYELIPNHTYQFDVDARENPAELIDYINDREADFLYIPTRLDTTKVAAYEEMLGIKLENGVLYRYDRTNGEISVYPSN